MTIIIVLLGALVLAALMIRLGRMPRSASLWVYGTLTVGVLAWTIAGQPAQPGAPVVRADPEGFGDELQDTRHGMTARFGAEAQWLGLSDGMLRMGRTELAAQTLEKGLRRYPRSVDLWIGYGNALVAHAGGTMTPAATMAFDRAAAIDPAHPAPDFFRGLGFAQAGDLAGAEQAWSALLARAPADAPVRADLEARLAQLRAARAAAQSAPQRPQMPAANR